MTYSFILDRPSSEEPTYILLIATLADGRKKFSIEEQILPTDWDKEFQRPKPVKDKQQAVTYAALRKKIDRIDHHLHDMVLDGKRHGKPIFKKDVRAALDVLLHKTAHVDHNDFFSVKDIIYKEMQDGKLLTRSGKRFSKGTLKNYGQTIGFLEEFSKKHSLNFSDVTIDTYREFVKFLNEKGYALNYVGQHVKNWKKIANEAFSRGWHQNTVFKQGEFATLDEETYDIYLTEEEIQKLYKQNCSYNKKRELARDWFIMDCYTGLRISDLKLLDKKNIQSGRITIANEKTDAKVVLPIHPFVQEIFKKYKGIPPKINDQEINDEIKKVAEICGINRPELYTVTEGGVRKDYYLKRYEMVSNHTARRSFITNLIKRGVPHPIIMKLAGIVKYSTLERYIKLSAEEVADQAADLDFFK